MKANAITRIVIYSIIILLLVGILCTCLGLGRLAFDFGLSNGTPVDGEGHVSAANVRDLEIDWVSGSVNIKATDTESIIFSETGGNEKYTMTYELDGGTLRLSYAKAQVSIGFVSTPSKDLTVTVPKDWACEELEINTASVDVDITDLTVAELSLNGASNNLRFNGNIESLECDGASNDLELVCTNSPNEINIDGASCYLSLSLPYDCGFRAELEGLNCDFNCTADYKTSDGTHRYGNEDCKIDVDGVSCDVTVFVPEEAKRFSVKSADKRTEELLIDALAESYPIGTKVTIKTEILTDVDLELYVDGVFISKQSEVYTDQTHHWEFTFTMPDHDAIIQLKSSGGMI